MFVRLRAMVRHTLRQEMAFRMNFIILFLGLPVRIAVMWMLWDFVISGRPEFGGLAQGQILFFVAFTSFLSYVYDNVSLLQVVERKLLTGGAVLDLTLPMDYDVKEIYSSWGTTIVYTMFGGTAFILMILIGGITPAPDPLRLILVLLIVLANTFLQYYLVMIIASLAVFVGTVDSLKYGLFSIMEFLGGALIPLAIFPGWLRTVLYFNPMSSMIDLPASVLVAEELDPVSTGLRVLLLFVWTIALYLINRKVWRYSLERFTAPGE